MSFWEKQIYTLMFFLFWLRFAYERYVYFSIHTVSSQTLFFDDFMPIRANVNIFCQNTVETKPFGVINIYIDVFYFQIAEKRIETKKSKMEKFILFSLFIGVIFGHVSVKNIIQSRTNLQQGMYCPGDVLFRPRISDCEF